MAVIISRDFTINLTEYINIWGLVMTPKRDTTNAGIYDKLESLRLEVKQDISIAVNTVAVSQGRLEKKFDNLEAGRLTRAEANINDLRLVVQKINDSTSSAEKTLSGKFLALGTIGVIILTAALNGLFLWAFSRLK